MEKTIEEIKDWLDNMIREYDRGLYNRVETGMKLNGLTQGLSFGGLLGDYRVRDLITKALAHICEGTDQTAEWEE